MPHKITLLAPLLGLALTACLANDPNVGAGPIELSPNVQGHFESYKKERSPGYFAVDLDGVGSFYNYCSAGRCQRSSANKVIYRCEQLTKGKPCKIYASKGNIVWKKDAAAAPD